MSVADRPTAVECAMCRQRLTALETASVCHDARLSDLAEADAAVKQELEGIREELRESISALRHEMRVTIDVLRVELADSRKAASKEVGALADSNARIEALLQRVLEAAAKK